MPGPDDARRQRHDPTRASESGLVFAALPPRQTCVPNPTERRRHPPTFFEQLWSHSDHNRFQEPTPPPPVAGIHRTALGLRRRCTAHRRRDRPRRGNDQPGAPDQPADVTVRADYFAQLWSHSDHKRPEKRGHRARAMTGDVSGTNQARASKSQPRLRRLCSPTPDVRAEPTRRASSHTCGRPTTTTVPRNRCRTAQGEVPPDAEEGPAVAGPSSPTILRIVVVAQRPQGSREAWPPPIACRPAQHARRHRPTPSVCDRPLVLRRRPTPPPT